MEEESKIVVNLAEGQTRADVIIRKTDEVNELPIKAQIKIALIGILSCVFEFLFKRITEKDQINQKRCHILVNREEMSLELITDEHDEYKRGSVKGKLEYHPQYIAFGINGKKQWDPVDLGQFFKMNRAFFLNKQENMDLVNKLKSFTANVNVQMEREQQQNGSMKDNYSAVVNSSLPGEFKVKLPLFKGRPAEEIEVEFYASVNGRTVTLQLVSPGACQTVEELRDNAIDEQLDKIRDLAPDIAIIEQ